MPQEQGPVQPLNQSLESLSKAKGRVDDFIQGLPDEQDEARSLLFQVRDSEDFRFAAEVTRKFVSQSAHTSVEIASKVAGFLFETLAYSYLKEQLLSEGKAILSPSETFEVYRLLNPDKTIIFDKFGLQYGIEGISVPDGIVFSHLNKDNTIKFDGVCKYTAGVAEKLRRGEQLARSSSSYGSNMRLLAKSGNPDSTGVAKYIRSKYPHLSNRVILDNNLDVYVAFPSNVEGPPKTSGVKEISIPLSSLTFRQFMGAFMADAQEKNGAS